MKKDNDSINKTFAVNYGNCDKGMYCCAICGKGYETIEERAACETKCIADRKKAEEALKKQKLEEEKNERKKEIEVKWKELNELTSEYIKDYGSIQLGERRLFDDDFFPSINKVLGWW